MGQNNALQMGVFFVILGLTEISIQTLSQTL